MIELFYAANTWLILHDVLVRSANVVPDMSFVFVPNVSIVDPEQRQLFSSQARSIRLMHLEERLQGNLRLLQNLGGPLDS